MKRVFYGGEDNTMTAKDGKRINMIIKRFIINLKKKFNMTIKYNDLSLIVNHIKDYVKKNIGQQDIVNVLYYLRDLVEKQNSINKSKVIRRMLTNFSIEKDINNEPGLDSFFNKKKIEYLQKKLPEMKYYESCDIEGYLKDEELGSGAFGEVYSIKNNPNIVVKTIDLTDYRIPSSDLYYDTLDDIINEINILKTLKGTKIAPEYYESWICKKNNILYVYIAEERMNRSYGDWIKAGNTISDETFTKLKNKLNKLHKLNIVHLDFHSGNIMLKVKEENGNTIVDPYINDFGISKFSKNIIKEEKQRDINAYNRLIDSFEKYKIEFISLIITYADFSILL